VLDQRGRLLFAALAFAGCSLPSYDRALWALRSWLDSWSGIGHVTVGMHRRALPCGRGGVASGRITSSSKRVLDRRGQLLRAALGSPGTNLGALVRPGTLPPAASWESDSSARLPAHQRPAGFLEVGHDSLSDSGRTWLKGGLRRTLA
jgi:hypothetical protein